ncbi:uncharacterized protein LOC132269834 [Cornus florida]|uniref:uncharacterized protein LOC132269834 n=1 Tax=Cornus florida TaxID=4283 RepID=UPI002898C188|nr:uncharacterized protein LOC132269834 [Cornus florida]
MFGEAGALTAKDLTKHDTKDDAVVDFRKGCFHKPSHDTTNAIFKPGREYAYCVLLLMATLVATITYQAAFSPLGRGTLKEGYAYDYDTNGFLQLRKPDSIITRSFLLLNSTGFVASVAMIIFLLHEFPLKP